MKPKFLSVFVIFCLIVSSCKNQSETESLTGSEAAAADPSLKVILELVVERDDNFHLYYTEDNTINFDEKHSVWVPVKGSPDVQKIVFTLPEDALPDHLRFDFGSGQNKDQSDIILKSFEVKYLDHSFMAKDKDVFNYFYPNQQNTVIDTATGAVKRLKQDQVGAPSLYPHLLLTEELDKITGKPS